MSRFINRFTRADAVGVATLAAVTAAAYFAGLEPLASARLTRASLIRQVDEEQNAGRTLAVSAAELRRRLDSLQTELSTSSSRLQSIAHQNDRLARIAALAAEMGITVDQLVPGTPTFEQRYGAVPIRLQARGDYVAMTRFIHRAAETFRDLGVDKLDITGAPTDADHKPIMTLDLVWYVLPSDRRG